MSTVSTIPENSEVNLDPVTIIPPLSEPSTVIWIVTAVYSPITRCNLVTGCTSTSIYIQRNVCVGPWEEIASTIMGMLLMLNSDIM